MESQKYMKGWGAGCDVDHHVIRTEFMNKLVQEEGAIEKRGQGLRLTHFEALLAQHKILAVIGWLAAGKLQSFIVDHASPERTYGHTTWLRPLNQMYLRT